LFILPWSELQIPMSFIDSIYNMFGGEKADPQCPLEAEILAYSESNLQGRERAKLERHFVTCNDCRDLLVLLAQFNDKPLESPGPLAESEVRNQTAKILNFIEADERKRAETAGQIIKPVSREREGIFISYSQLATAALFICAIGLGIFYLSTRNEKPETAAMRQLAKVQQDKRPSEMRTSGNLPYSPYTSFRGASESDDHQLKLKRALNKLKFAENDGAPPQARQTLARVHLAFEEPGHARSALKILEQLVAKGVETSEVFNDIGVAQLQLANYGESIESFSKALEKSPAYDVALFNKALAEERAGHKEDAKRDWQRFINLPSDSNWKAEAEDHLRLLSTSSNQ
jgi:hypothetical protein